MGKIILNDIEYGIGISNGVNVDTTNLVEKDSIVTTLDDTVTDEQIPSAKAVHTAIQNLSVGVPADVYSKTEVDDLLADKADTSAIIDAYTKTEVNDLLDDKANTDDLVDSYNKEEVDNLLANKADTTALDDKIDKTAIVTSISSTSTKKQVPSAKAVHTAIQEAKTELENEIANIPKVTKTSELTNNSGYITANDIPVTLPASDVYAWAKATTKPTYTASEVGALASNGTAVNASKVNNLTVETAVPANAIFTDTNTWRGIQNNLTSTSTTESLSAYQGKVLNDELQSLKTTSVNGKQTVADAINGKCGTSLTSATTYADMAYYISSISTGALSKNYLLATSGSISQKIKLAIIVFKGADESFTLEFASAMSGYIYYASNTGSTYDSRSSFTSTTTKLSKTVSNAMAIIVFDKPVAISSITCSSDCRGIFIY